MNLHSLLNPNSIALVGVSKDSSRIGGRILRYLKQHGYGGLMFPVNPKYEEIGGERCYPTLGEIPHAVDVVLIAVPEEALYGVLEEAGKKRIKSAIIYSAGFSEVGGKGAEKQKRLKQVAKEYGIAVCGPNCVGIIGFHNKAAMSFSQVLDLPKLSPGKIAFISQSGALGGAILNRVQDMGIGISYFISTGNEAVLESSDFMEYLLDDHNTAVIMALIEGFRDGGKFLKVADLAVKKGKPIIVMKVGRTDAGRIAASSHTGSMTGSDAVYDAIFRQAGVIRVEGIEDLYLTASVFAKCPLPGGNRVGILTTTGGGGVILTDKLVEMGMSLPELSPKTVEKLTETAATFGIIKNPLDLTAQVVNDPLLFPKSVETLVQDNNLDAIIVAIAMVAGERSRERASYIIEAASATKKPVLSWWAAGSLSGPGTKVLEESQIPLFSSPDCCVKSLSSLVRYSSFLQKIAPEMDGKRFLKSIGSQVKEVLRTAGVITEVEGKRILASYGIPVTREELGRDLAEIKGIASRIGYPVALKIVSPQIQHKTETGGLKLNLRGERDLSGAFDEIMENVRRCNPQAEIKGVLVQEMAPPGKEVIVGVVRDPQFGVMVMFGLGGVLVEVFKDVSLRHAPLREKDAWEMIREVRGYAILEGVRGEERSDLDAIVKTLLAVSEMAVDLEDIFSEVDINPLVVYPGKGGVKSVDCLFVKRKIFPG